MVVPPSVLNFYATFSASIRSVGTAVTLAAVGVYLHRRNFVSSEGKRTLARISQQVTFPLFLFTKICYCNQDWSSEPCPDVTQSLKDVWILLFWPAVVVGIGLSVGYFAAKFSDTPKSQFRSVLAACGFGNSTGLPITLLTVVHANFPATSDLGRIDPTLFLSVYLLLYPVLQWGVGGWLLAPQDETITTTTTTTPQDEEALAEKAAASLGENENEQDPAGRNSTSSILSNYYPRSPLNSSSLRKNVLNNKAKESFYKLSRQAIGETDASLYISDADLVHYNSESPAGSPPRPKNLPLSPSQEFVMGMSIDEDGEEAEAEAQENGGETKYQGRKTKSSSWLPIGGGSSAPLSPIQDHYDHSSSNHVDTTCTAAPPIPPVGSFEPPPPDETTTLLPAASTESSNFSEPGPPTPGIHASSTRSSRDSAAASVKTHESYEGETLCETCNKIMTRCFQPPVVGALAGIFVASTPLRGILVDLVDRSSSAPLEWLFDGLYAVGQAAVPINMIILGCNLSASHQTQRAKKKVDAVEIYNGDQPTTTPSISSNLLSQKTMIAIVISKMLIMPLIGMLLAVILNVFILDIPDEIAGSFYLVLMIVFITPTANNVMVMVELSGSNTKEGIAQVIALQYACAPLMLSLTMSLVVGLASDWS